MSEKFVVGQWVTCDVGVCRVRINDTDETVLIENAEGERIGWRGLEQCVPFVWQVGKTYRTTLDGVTATVDAIVGGRILVICDWKHPTEQIHAATFSAGTGLLSQFETRTDVPHLLPYLADEPPPVADAATCDRQTRHGKLLAKINERAAEDGGDDSKPPADESDDVNHPTHYTQHPSGVECVAIAEHFNFNIGNAIKYLWRAGLKGDAVEDLRKAAWYVQREIERRAKR